MIQRIITVYQTVYPSLKQKYQKSSNPLVFLKPFFIYLFIYRKFAIFGNYYLKVGINLSKSTPISILTTYLVFLVKKMNKAYEQQSLAKWQQKYRNKLNEVNARVAANRAPPHDETIFMNEALRMLKDAVQFDKKKYRYEIRQQINDRVRLTEQSYKVKRLLKLRFRCQDKKCKSYNEVILHGIRCNQWRKWTSYFGIVMLIFNLRYGPNGLSIVYSLKVFKQRCLQCKQWGISGFYQSGLNSILDLFNLIIRNVLQYSRCQKAYGFSWGYLQKAGHKPIVYNKGIGHQSKLCQGCMQGQCINYYRQKQPSEKPQQSEKDQYFSDSSSVEQKKSNSKVKSQSKEKLAKIQQIEFLEKIIDNLKKQKRSLDRRSHSSRKSNHNQPDLPWSDQSKSIQDTGKKRKHQNWQLKK